MTSRGNSPLLQDPDTEEESDKGDITHLSNDFFGNRFSAHAIPHAANTSHSHCRRLVWAVLSVILLFSVLVLISHLLNEYFKYPKQVTIEIEELEEVVFPSVTVCNFNIVKLSKVVQSKFKTLVDLEKRSGREDCENYEDTAPWVLEKDYEAFTARNYWAVNTLKSESVSEDVYFNVTTEAPTTEGTTTKATTTEATTTTTGLPTECPTKDGKKCTFPFFYYGRGYEACVRRDEKRAWCATEVDRESNYVGVWSYCSEECPVGNKLERAAMEKDPETIQKKDFDSLPFHDYQGYQPKVDERTKSVKWCHRDRPNDCLETFGLENIDPYDFRKLLLASKRDDLSDLRDAFTPDPDDIDSFGQKPQEFITSCTFDKANCSFRDFYVWQSDTYGNCFTFNSPNLYLSDGQGGFKRDNYIRNTTKSGYQNGLRLTLNLDVHNYVSLLTPDLGVRVVVHAPKQTPIPEEEGFSIAPGFLTSIGIRLKTIYRIGPPYGVCHPLKWRPYPREYSQTSCRMLCVEERIQEKCFCSNSINDLLLALQTTLPRCNPTNLTQDLCRQLVMKRVAEEKLCDCPPACEDIIYTPLISTNQVNMRFFNIIKNFKGIYVGDDVCSQSQNSTARLHIYLESLQQESIRETPAKTATSLIADIGGHLGLFIGISIATVLELMEFCFDAFIMGGKCNNCCRRRSAKRPVSQIASESNKSPIIPVIMSPEFDQDKPEDREPSSYSIEENQRTE